MKYYQIDLDFESNGLKNSINQIEISKEEIKGKDTYRSFFEFFNGRNIDFWSNQSKIKEIKIPPIPAKVIKKARIADVMGYTENISFLNNLYSEKFISIIKAFDIGNYTTFEVNINDVPEKYYMLFIEAITLDEINYEKSIIITGHKAANNIKYHTINNRNEYLNFKNINILGGFEKIAIPKNCYGKDIINIQAASRLFYSEKLIDFLLDCGITGIDVRHDNSIQLEFV